MNDDIFDLINNSPEDEEEVYNATPVDNSPEKVEQTAPVVEAPAVEIPAEPAPVNAPAVEPVAPKPPVQQPSASPYPPKPPVNNQSPYIQPNGYPTQQQNGYQYYQPPVQKSNSYYPPTPQNPAPKKKKKSKAVWVITAIAVACVIFAIVGIKSLSSSDSNPINSFDGSGDSSVSQHEDGGVTAKVESSDETAKKDKNGDLTAAGVAQEVINSCVGITVYSDQSSYSYFYNFGESGSEGDEDVASGEGSGVIMAEKNGKTYIMTCAHVISQGSKFKVTLNDDTELDAKMVGYDAKTDIGVLVVDKSGLKVATFGDSKDIELGEPCVAIGCPGGLEFKNSVTQGIVSALARPVQSQIGYNNECIQVDAAINPGNSGGALFNMQGQVIGINSSKIASTEYEGMGFAVPSNTAIETANSLIKNGYVAGRAKLGITYNTLENYSAGSSVLSELAAKGYKNAKGAMVIEELSSDSDLNGKDIQKYDMIVAVNGDTMTSTDVMTSVLNSSKPGDTVTLTIARATNSNTIKIFEVKCKLIESKE